MTKKILAVLLTLAMALSFAACDGTPPAQSAAAKNTAAADNADPGAAQTQADPVQAADSVWYNGNICTADDDNPSATALAVADGTLVYVGDDEGVQPYIGTDTKVIDLQGKCVLPGIIESHLHVEAIGENEILLNVFWLPKDTILQMVREKAEAAKPGDWIVGQGWMNTIWDDADFPTKEELDAVAPDNPVFLSRADGHTVWVNSLALKLAGITKDTPDPDGGCYYHKENGELSGIATDTAIDPIEALLPPLTEEQETEAVTLAGQELLSYGITSCMDAGVPPQELDLYENLIASGDFKVRVDAEINLTSLDDEGAQYIAEHEPQPGLLDNHLDIIAVKIIGDGSMGGRSAAMLEPYSDYPGYYGEARYTDEQMDALVAYAYNLGYQVSTHAIGDATNRQVIDAYEKVLTENPRDARLRIEHFQCADPADIARAVKLGIIPSMQSIHATSDMLVVEDRWGAERMKGAYAWRTILDLGGIIANGSDAPVELVNPFHGFYASVTRQGRNGSPEGGWYPAQCMTREEALKSFTIWGAYAMFDDNIKGSLKAGKLADFVVIDRDYYRCEDWMLMNIQALTTVIGGEVVYEKDTSVPTVSFEGVPVTFNAVPYTQAKAIYVPLADLTNALGVMKKDNGDGTVTVTGDDAKTILPTVFTDGVTYVDAGAFYGGLGYKVAYTEISNTLSVGTTIS